MDEMEKEKSRPKPVAPRITAAKVVPPKA